MRTRLVILLPCLLAAACATGPDRRVVLSALVGQPETEAVRQLGVPNRAYEAGGRKFLAYDERRADVIPAGPFIGGFGTLGYGGYGYGSFAFPPQVIERGCETTLEVAAGRVVSWSLRGNACG